MDYPSDLTRGYLRRREHIAKWLSLTALLGAVCVLSCDGAVAAQTKVYRCQVGEQQVFSDQPCGPAEQGTEIVLPVSNTYSGADATPKSKDVRSPSPKQPVHKVINKHSESIAAEQLRDKQRCQRLADQLETIQSKMRIGYTAKQGERLRERQRQLEQQRQTERCH